ncbi:MAG: hypothetical protein IJT32_06100 [Lachnospiraceae bacterium]|nr:hypothetical protein [Lachnospiraceae bacterium]
MARFHPAGAKSKSAVTGLWCSLGLFAIVVGIFIFGTISLSSGSTKRQRESLQNALTRDIVYCYATTGKYPESLTYIKDTYGLYYNDELFYVDYKIRGSNLFPDVTIIDLVGEKAPLPQRIVAHAAGMLKEFSELKGAVRKSIVTRRRASEIQL